VEEGLTTTTRRTRRRNEISFAALANTVVLVVSSWFKFLKYRDDVPQAANRVVGGVWSVGRVVVLVVGAELFARKHCLLGAPATSGHRVRFS